MRHLFFAAASVFLSHSPAALALEGWPDSDCRQGMFGGPYKRAPDLRLGRIVGDTRAFFLSDMDGCPVSPAQGRDCHDREFINLGSAVAVLPSNVPGFVCVLYPASPDQPAGWLPQARVRVSSPDRAPPLKLWIGKWRNGDDTIVMKANRNGDLSIRGHAYWPGRNIAPMNTGDISFSARPEGNRVTFSDSDSAICITKLELLSPNILAANDNGQCGGGNVSFGQVYTRSQQSRR